MRQEATSPRLGNSGAIVPPTAHPTAEDRQWRRRRRRGSRSGGSLHGLRISDLETYIAHRYPNGMEDDDAARDDAAIMLHHMAHYAVDPRGRMLRWLGTRCSWMPELEAARMVANICSSPRRYKADTLAIKLNLTAAERTALSITTIGAVDLLKEKRITRRRQRDVERKKRNRRARGARPRAEYESKSLTRAKPWVQEGISRRTWERRRHRAASPATAHA